MERLTGRNEKGDLLVNEKIVYAGELYELASKLEEYEDIKQRLEKVYGKCNGMIETTVRYLEKHEGVEIGNPGKAVILTDDEVDKWNEYNKIGTVEEVREAVEKRKTKKITVKVRENDLKIGHITFEVGTKTYWCPECEKPVSGSCKYCPNCGQRLEWK